MLGNGFLHLSPLGGVLAFPCWLPIRAKLTAVTAGIQDLEGGITESGASPHHTGRHDRPSTHVDGRR